MEVYVRLTFQVADGNRTRQRSVCKKVVTEEATAMSGLMFEAMNLGALPEKNMYYEIFKQ